MGRLACWSGPKHLVLRSPLPSVRIKKCQRFLLPIFLFSYSLASIYFGNAAHGDSWHTLFSEDLESIQAAEGTTSSQAAACVARFLPVLRRRRGCVHAIEMRVKAATDGARYARASVKAELTLFYYCYLIM